jgi:hypothetical protein
MKMSPEEKTKKAYLLPVASKLFQDIVAALRHVACDTTSRVVKVRILEQPSTSMIDNVGFQASIEIFDEQRMPVSEQISKKVVKLLPAKKFQSFMKKHQ